MGCASCRWPEPYWDSRPRLNRGLLGRSAQSEVSMSKTNWEWWGAASGYLVLVLGIAAAAFERGAPPANAPAEESLAFFTTYRSELRMQSLLFVLSAGVYLWSFGSLRSFLLRAGAAAERL